MRLEGVNLKPMQQIIGDKQKTKQSKKGVPKAPQQEVPAPPKQLNRREQQAQYANDLRQQIQERDKIRNKI